MSPITHLFISWQFANMAELDGRDRALVTASGIIPDLDGLGIAVDLILKDTSYSTDLWTRFHHVLGHNIGFCLMIALVTLCFARRRVMTTALVFFTFHVHLLCDLLGARGPDGFQWLIPYLAPFSGEWQLMWEGQWALNAWPNFAVTAAALILTFYIAVKKGRSPLGLISLKADQAFVTALRKRFSGRM